MTAPLLGRVLDKESSFFARILDFEDPILD
jgi:hypothetical protein